VIPWNAALPAEMAAAEPTGVAWTLAQQRRPDLVGDTFLGGRHSAPCAAYIDVCRLLAQMHFDEGEEFLFEVSTSGAR